VRPHQPVGHGLPDLRGCQTLVVAVIPFGQKGRHLVDCESGELSGDERTPPRAGHDEGVVEAQHGQRVGSELRLFAARLGEIEFGAAGVPA
jgi:hypothetical protein